jgi:UDP-glucose 4-epimerase
VFNVGSGVSIRLLDLVAALNEIFETDLEPDFQPPRAGDVRDSLASLVRINKAFDYHPLVSFEEGLRRTVASSVSSISPRARDAESKV